jgi:hypothetical protein
VRVYVGVAGKVGEGIEIVNLGILHASMENPSNNATGSSFFMEWTIHAREGHVKEG